MKALIFSDLHLHAHKDRIDRLQDCLKVLNWAFDTALKEGCEAIFFLGDLFHERAKIDVLNYLRTFEVIYERMTGDCKNLDFYLLVGNHDMYHRERWDVNSVRPLSAIPGIHIVQSPVTIQLGGRQIDWLPHTENPVAELERLKEDAGQAGDILFAHVAVHGAMLNTLYGTRSDVIVEHDNEMMPVDVACFDEWKMTILGHYHGAQNLSDKVEYIGSPLQLGFGEAFQTKHLMVLDLTTMKKKYIENTFSPKHLLISPEDAKNQAYNLTGQFVRIVVTDIGKKDLVDLKRMIAAEYKPLSLDMKQKDKKKDEPDDSHIVEEARAILKDTKAMLKQYVEDVGVPDGLDKDHLLAIGDRCLEEIT